MKNMKPIALILFGLALIICGSAYTGIQAEIEVIAMSFMGTGLFLSLVGLIWALRQK